MLTIAVSSRTLFNIEDGHKLYTEKGNEAFTRYMYEKEKVPLRPGVAFPLIEKLLALNVAGEPPLVDVTILSRNSPASGTRVMNSVAHYGLPIERAVFTAGRDRFRYAQALGVDLFLSAHDEDVSAAIRFGIPSAALLPQDAIASRADSGVTEGEIRIALDGDSVIFSDEADKLYRASGLAAFRDSEEKLAKVPLQPGPFKPLLDKLHALRQAVGTKLRIALVTARGIPAHERALHTLLAWGIELDELMLCAGVGKGPLLRAYGADLFFDDTRKHVDSANDCGIPAGHVPVGEGGIVTE